MTAMPKADASPYWYSADAANQHNRDPSATRDNSPLELYGISHGCVGLKLGVGSSSW